MSPELLVDPPASSAITHAVGWVEGSALGTLATIVAIIAVARIGLAMLTGRLVTP